MLPLAVADGVRLLCAEGVAAREPSGDAVAEGAVVGGVETLAEMEALGSCAAAGVRDC